MWQLTRRIDDRYGRMRGDFSGAVVLTPVGLDLLDYSEEGHMIYNNSAPMKATQTYRWHFLSGLVFVRFADGRDFHSFIPAGQMAGTDHPCGDDHYSVVYDFTRWPDWRVTWVVVGPRKNYISVSNYDRRSAYTAT